MYDITSYLAIWGAVISTIALVWNIVKWHKSGAKVKGKIKLNVGYLDSKILKTTKTENGTSSVLEEYCHVELVNTGTLPTTITNISATHSSKNNKFQFSIAQQVFEIHFGKTLPCAISSGDIWSCRLPMSRYIDLFEYGTPEIHINISTLDKPLVLQVSKPENEKAKLQYLKNK